MPAAAARATGTTDATAAADAALALATAAANPTRGSAVRHLRRRRLVQKDARLGIKNADIRRIARRGGVKRMAGDIYEEARQTVVDFLDEILQHAITYTEHAHRRTVTTMDIVYAVKRMGHHKNKQLYIAA